MVEAGALTAEAHKHVNYSGKPPGSPRIIRFARETPPFMAGRDSASRLA